MRMLVSGLMFMACAMTTPVSAQSADTRVAAFQQLCSTPRPARELAADAVAAGWSPATAEQTAPLATFLQTMEQVFRGQGAPAPTSTVLVKNVGQRQFHLLVSEARLPQMMMYSCTIYDFADAADPVPDSVSEWLGVSPEVRRAEGMLRYDWRQPTALPRVFSVKMGQVSSGGAASLMLGYAGYSISMEGVGPLPQ